MSHMSETRRRWQAPTGSRKVFFDGNASEYEATSLHLQAAHIAARFAVSEAVARVVAEHAFAARPQR